jgi:hypothetical protein
MNFPVADGNTLGPANLPPRNLPNFHRIFFLGLALCAMLFFFPAKAFATNPEVAAVPGRSTYSGTLIFGDTSIRNENGAFGAITSQQSLIDNLPTQLNSPFPGDNSFRSVRAEIDELAATNSAVVVADQSTSFRTDGNEITPLQIALGAQTGFLDEEITPAPEPATSIAAALAVVTVAWSQRHRFRGFYRRCRFYPF